MISSHPWHVERQIRDLFMGRKNHYGSKSLRGTEVAALLYSLIDTAKLPGEDPYTPEDPAAYLTRASYAAIANPGTAALPGAPA